MIHSIRMKYPLVMTLPDLTALFGFDVTTFIDHSTTIQIENFLTYRKLDVQEQSKALRHLDRYLREDRQVVASQERTAKWEEGWNYNLQTFLESKSYQDLQPQYYRAKEKVAELIGLNTGEYVYRYKKELIATPNPNFEEIFAEVVRQAVLRRYFYGYKAKRQVEFGCGSCLNILRMAKDQPDVTTYAIDFVQPPLDIAKEIGRNEQVEIRTILQDMRDMSDFNQDFSNSRIFTFGALEQLGGIYGAESWLNWAANQNNSKFVLVEPCVETYDLMSAVDLSALSFHLKRGYTSGIISSLKSKERNGVISNLKVHRIQFGSLFIEGYTLIVFETIC